MKVKLLSDRAKLPTKNNSNDAGLDLYSPIDATLLLESYETLDTESNVSFSDTGRAVDFEAVPKSVKIPLDIAIELPPNTVGIIMPRSSMNARGINTAIGVIDEGYRGNIAVILTNIAGREIEEIKYGDKIAQLVILPVIHECAELTEEELSTTSRGDNGFGSSGR